MTSLDLYTAADKIADDEMGYTVSIVSGKIQISLRGRYLGYITEDDLSGGTGTCRNVQRSGHIAQILRR